MINIDRNNSRITGSRQEIDALIMAARMAGIYDHLKENTSVMFLLKMVVNHGAWAFKDATSAWAQLLKIAEAMRDGQRGEDHDDGHK